MIHYSQINMIFKKININETTATIHTKLGGVCADGVAERQRDRSVLRGRLRGRMYTLQPNIKEGEGHVPILGFPGTTGSRRTPRRQYHRMKWTHAYRSLPFIAADSIVDHRGLFSLRFGGGGFPPRLALTVAAGEPARAAGRCRAARRAGGCAVRENTLVGLRDDGEAGGGRVGWTTSHTSDWKTAPRPRPPRPRPLAPPR
jgi:hypothetical protein